jgi:hypothetical protein
VLLDSPSRLRIELVRPNRPDRPLARQCILLCLVAPRLLNGPSAMKLKRRLGQVDPGNSVIRCCSMLVVAAMAFQERFRAHLYSSSVPAPDCSLPLLVGVASRSNGVPPIRYWYRRHVARSGGHPTCFSPAESCSDEVCLSGPSIRAHESVRQEHKASSVRLVYSNQQDPMRLRKPLSRPCMYPEASLILTGASPAGTCMDAPYTDFSTRL